VRYFAINGDYFGEGASLTDAYEDLVFKCGTLEVSECSFYEHGDELRVQQQIVTVSEIHPVIKEKAKREIL